MLSTSHWLLSVHKLYMYNTVIVPNMKVWGQQACPEAKKKFKKKYCVVNKYMFVVHDISNTHDVYLYKSAMPSSC